MEFVWKILLCKACLVESFPSQIVRWIIFIQIYLGRMLPSLFFVEMFLQVPVADFFIFLWWFISKIALYRLLFREFLGKHVSSSFFDTGFY